MFLEVIAFYFKCISAVCHRYFHKRNRLFHRLPCKVLVDVCVTHVDEDYLLCCYRCVPLAEINAVFKSHVVLWVATALFCVYKIVYQRVIVMVGFDHDAVEVFEVKAAVHGVRDKHDTLLCWSFDEKTVIWHVVSDFKGLDCKSPNERLLSRRKRLYAPNQAFFE